MPKFFDRELEFQELDEVQGERGAHFIIIYGRRRVGKTTLLMQWVKHTQLPFFYWVARRETAEASRHNMARSLWSWAYPDTPAPEPPRFESWSLLFEQMARMIGEKPVIMIFDEFPYAVESDPSLPSHLQATWDHHLKEKPLTLILAGSHIGMMVDLLHAQAPLYGRITAQLPVEPLSFSTLSEFFPLYSTAERVATYAVLGGVPAYLERFSDRRNLGENIRRHLFRRTGMFRNEPEVLIGDLVRETRTYEAVLRAVAMGNHTPGTISKVTGLASPNISPYLARLRELGLIERRIPATIPPEQRRSTTRSRYHLRDSYLRFYFRFVEPNLEMVEQGLNEILWERISEQFRAFVGMTAFEELCREWTLIKARRRELPLNPETIGNHWATDSQVDVVAVNWRDKSILLGECKWGANPLGRTVIEELVEKTPKVVPSEEWKVYYAYFARAGFTKAAREEAQKYYDAILVDLEDLDNGLKYSVLG